MTSVEAQRGIEVAISLWPGIKLMPSGSYADRKLGIDGYEDGKTLQVKYDIRMAETNNLYHEVYEKTKGQPWQPWRHSPGLVDEYIIITEGFGVRIPVAILAELEKGKPLCQIRDTSMGFLVPLVEIPQCHTRRWKA